MSKPLLTLLATASVLALPAVAHSRQVTLTAQLKNYGGDGAYLAAYLTDAKGAYVRTLWVARPSTTSICPTGAACQPETPSAWTA